MTVGYRGNFLGVRGDVRRLSSTYISCRASECHGFYFRLEAGTRNGGVEMASGAVCVLKTAPDSSNSYFEGDDGEDAYFLRLCHLWPVLDHALKTVFLSIWDMIRDT